MRLASIAGGFQSGYREQRADVVGIWYRQGIPRRKLRLACSGAAEAGGIMDFQLHNTQVYCRLPEPGLLIKLLLLLGLCSGHLDCIYVFAVELLRKLLFPKQ